MKLASLFLVGLFTTALVSVIACGGGEPTPAPTNTPAAAPPAALSASAGAASVAKSKRAQPHISTIGDTLQFDRAKLQETAIYSVRLTFTMVKVNLTE